MPEENSLDLEDFKRLATSLIGWDNLTECWPASNEWDWEVGHRSDEGNTYPVMTIATADYGAAYDAEKMARYHAALRPSAVLALIAENEALRNECTRLAEDNRGLLEHPEDAL